MTINIEGHPEGETSPEVLAWVLSIANDMRSLNGDRLLDDLPKSQPGMPSECIIANAFNYGCQVGPVRSENNTGSIIFFSAQDAKNYLTVMDISMEDALEYMNNHSMESVTYKTLEHYELVYGSVPMPLTPELNKIANLFDEGELFSEYWHDHYED